MEAIEETLPTFLVIRSFRNYMLLSVLLGVVGSSLAIVPASIAIEGFPTLPMFAAVVPCVLLVYGIHGAINTYSSSHAAD